MLDGLIGIHGHDFSVAVTISVWPIRCRYSDVRNQTHKKFLLIMIDLRFIQSNKLQTSWNISSRCFCVQRMTDDWFCVDALNGKYDDKVLIFFSVSRVSYRVYLAQRTQGYTTALMLHSLTRHVSSPKFSLDSANNQCFSFSIIFLGSLQVDKCGSSNDQLQITAKDSSGPLTPWIIAVICLGAIALLIFGAWLIYAFTHPNSTSGLWLCQVCSLTVLYKFTSQNTKRLK